MHRPRNRWGLRLGILALGLLLPGSVGAVTCGLSVNATQFSTCPTSNLPRTIVYDVTSSPSGMEACIGGTRGGVPDPPSPVCIGPTNQSLSYTFVENQDEDEYTRFVEIRDSTGAVMCSTSPINITVEGPCNGGATGGGEDCNLDESLGGEECP